MSDASHRSEPEDGSRAAEQMDVSPSPRKGTKTQSPTPLDPASRRTSHSLDHLANDAADTAPQRNGNPTDNVPPTVSPPQPIGSGAVEASPASANLNLLSPGASFVALSSAATSSPGPGRRSPTNFTNSVAASVVRNALPQDHGGSPDICAGLSQRMAASFRGGEMAISRMGSTYADPSTSVTSSSHGGVGGDNKSFTTTTAELPALLSGAYLLPLHGAGAAAATTPKSTDANLTSPELSPFSRERAEKNFSKARDLVLEHIRLRHERQKAPPAAEATPDDAGGATAAAVAAAATAAPPPNAPHFSPSSRGPASPVDEEGDGGKLYNVIRAAMKEADTIDNAESNGNADSAAHMDWRDDDMGVQAPSAFFRSSASLESTSNRVMEMIIAKGHAAATDEELRWLYRHAHLLNLLDKDDLSKIAATSLRREYMKGDTIVNQHSEVKHLYTVLWGDVEVFRATSLDEEQRALEAAFRATTTSQSEQQQQQHQQQLPLSTPNSSGAVRAAPVRTSAHDLAEIQTRQRARSHSGTGTAFSFNATTNDGGGGGAGDDGDDVMYTHVATLLPGQVFATESFVFGQANHFTFRAGGSTTKTVVSLIPFSALTPALETNPRFAQGVGSAIAGSVDVFGPIRRFCRYVFSSQTSQNDYLPLWSIVAAYTQISNVIHTKLFSTELDTGAWGYALNRLPENVTSTFCFDLVHALPPFVASRMRVEAYAADVSKAPQSSSDVSRTRTAVAYIRTKERRRCTWLLGMEGKDLVLLRDGFTDLLDFITMLCVHIIESNKLRGRVQGMVHPPAIDILDTYLRARDKEFAENKVIAAEEEMSRIKRVLARMPLTPDEQNGLMRNWGQDTLLKIYEVMMHREEFNIRVDPSVSRKFQINPFHEWALNLRGCVMRKLGLDKSHALPNDVFIDVVSSNTHCIKNLLCSFNRKYREQILEYAVKKEVKKLGNPDKWHTIDDMIYVATSGFLRDERPDLKEEFQKSLEENGITVLHDTAMTGLQVDVIPVHSLNLETIDETIRNSLRNYFENTTREHTGGESGPSSCNPLTWTQVCKPMYTANNVKQHKQQQQQQQQQQRPTDSAGRTPTSTDSPSSHQPTSASSPCSPLAPAGARLQRHFIINMDFAFGAQAEGICRAIFSAFGKRIRSVSVMGKAGGLQGKRGDIQLASHVLLSKSSLILEDNQDELRSCRNQDLTKERLQELAGPNVVVHHGKVLTVTGTMLQNASLLRYYKNVWRCVGTEMEGSYFARVIEDFYRQGIANTGLRTRFAYYTSDLPLAQSEAEEESKSAKKHSGGAAAATLSAPMTSQEGVPPLYAIARGILENILLS